MTARYKLDPTRGRFTVQAFATGLLSALGHSPTFAVRDYHGGMHFEGDEIKGMVLDMTIRADSLELQDRVREADAREIMDRMRRDVLETSTYPEITFRSADVSSDPIAPGRFRVRFGGPLILHGVTATPSRRRGTAGLRRRRSPPGRIRSAYPTTGSGR